MSPVSLRFLQSTDQPFEAGLGTNLKELKQSGLKATLIACMGVLVQIILGALLLMCFYGFDGKDSLRIGVGMMTRGEVALITAQKGLAVGLLTAEFFTPVILLILVSSVITPILLKKLYRGSDEA